MIAQRGFTRIEIMIAVASLGIMASIGAGSFTQYLGKVFNASAISEARNMLTFETAFYNTYYRYAPVAIADKNAQGIIAKNTAIRFNAQTTDLQDSDVPESTADDNLTGWSLIQ